MTVQVSPTVTMTPRPIVTVTPWPIPSVSPTPFSTPIPSSTPSPQLPPTPWPTATPLPEPTVSATPSLSLTPEPSPIPEQTPHIVINEIAWAGTSASPTDEWIELYNSGNSEVDLVGWSLHGDPDGNGNTRIILLSGIIPADGYFLIERTDDMTISDIAGDMAGPFGGSGLKNDPGEDIRLVDGSGAIIDRVDCSGGWFAGDSGTKSSMERRDPFLAGSDGTNWATNDGSVRVGSDAAGQQIQGTPRYQNSVAKP